MEGSALSRNEKILSEGVTLIRKEPILDKKAGYVSIIILAVFFFPLTFVHEFGHVVVCAAEGYSYQMQVGITAAKVHCDGTPSNLIFYWAFGGIFAALAALSPLIAWKWAIQNKGILIGSFTIATGHGVNGVVEAFVHEWYVMNVPFATVLVVISTLLAFTAFLLLLGKRRILREPR